jgi:hypothetical protein
MMGMAVPLAWLPGCASVREMPFDASMFPSRSVEAADRAPGRVALVAAPAVIDQVHQTDSGPGRRMRVPVGRIVVQAMLMAADAAFEDGAQRFDQPPPASAGFGAALVIDSVRLAYQSRTLWLMPLLPLGGVGDLEYTAQLGFELSLRDGQGRAVWTRSYDSGRQIWPHEWAQQTAFQTGLLRLTHELAWRLSQQVIRELRDWTRAARLRPAPAPSAASMARKS